MKPIVALMVDSYKHSHYKMLPEGTRYTSFYIEARGGPTDFSIAMGTQGLVNNYFTLAVTADDVDYAEGVCKAQGICFNRKGWDIIVNELEGKLPLRINAVPEGTIVPIKNALVTVTNTDPRFGWLPGLLETPVLRSVWYPTTVATECRVIRDVIESYLEATGDVAESPYKLVDFGARGVSSHESAGIGGMAHLTSFDTTDTLEGVVYVMDNYKGDIVGGSIAAGEHSCITSWARDKEFQAYEHIIKKFPNQMLALPIDSYDTFKAIEFLGTLSDTIKDQGTTLILRPDSGDPVTMVTGYSFCHFTGSQQAHRTRAIMSDAEFMGVVEYAMEVFGFYLNEKGFKVLPDHIRVIQGDGINVPSITEILDRLVAKGISASNISFGRGGAGLQGVGRDDQAFAMKCSAIKAKDGHGWNEVCKDPITDPGKKSKVGVLDLRRNNLGELFTSRLDVSVWQEPDSESAMVVVFEDGEQFNKLSFAEVRANSNF